MLTLQSIIFDAYVIYTSCNKRSCNETVTRRIVTVTRAIHIKYVPRGTFPVSVNLADRRHKDFMINMINLESHACYLVSLNTLMPLRVTSRGSYPTVVGQILNRMCIQNGRNRNLQFKRSTSEFSLG